MSMHSSEHVRDTGFGATFFASLLMVIGGVMSVLMGVAGIFHGGAFFVKPAEYWISIDMNAWGWTHVGFGALLLLAGFGVMSGATWARWLGIGIASVCAVVNFMFIPVFPLWALALVALDLWVVYALAAHKRGAEMVYLNAGSATVSETAPRSTSASAG